MLLFISKKFRADFIANALYSFAFGQSFFLLFHGYFATILMAEGHEHFSDVFLQLSFVYEAPGWAEETCVPCREEAGCEYRKRRRLQA